MEFTSANPSVVRSVKRRQGRADRRLVQAISIEGRFKVNNLMGITSGTTPVSVVRAAIDLDFVPGTVVHHASDDVIELS